MQCYFATTGWLTELQIHAPNAIAPAILGRYRILYDAYVAQRHLIPPEQLYEISFSVLEADPITQVQAIYQALSLNYSDTLNTLL
ncbi:MAG: sulfotransferase [Cyanobacteria bacterium P01_F01_bin.150]